MLSAKVSVATLAVFSAALLPGQENDLELRPGTPLHIRLEAKAPIRAGQAVRGVLVHPIYVFDRQVLPAGTAVSGSVTEVRPAPRSIRLRAYLNGRLRTRKEALVLFDGISLPDGRKMPFRSFATAGYSATVVRVADTISKTRGRGALGEVRRRATEPVANHEAVKAARTLARGQAPTRLISGILGGLKKEALSYWPFGNQYLARDTAFCAVLGDPLTFDSGGAAERQALGTAPPSGTVVRARLTHALSSATARVGSPVHAVMMEPVFSETGALLLPSGTAVRGEVTQAMPARRFGRNGNLRMRFTEFDSATATTSSLPVTAMVEAVETSHPGMQLDAEGLASMPVSKKRFIYPAIAAGLATNAVPDAENSVKVQGGAPGWSGFGLAGTGAALATHAAAGPFGWWGVASSTYDNLIRKANDLEFPAHTVLEIRFGRPAAGPVLAEAPARQPSLGQ